MKKTGIKGIWAAAAIAMMAAAGCSDGELWSGGMGFTPDLTPAPLIVSFKADPAQVKPGEPTTISWEVADADTIQVTAIASDGSAVPFNVQTTELAGQAPVASLTATTDFVLTATKTFAVPEGEGGGEVAAMKADELAPTPGQSSSSQTITVTVLSPMAINATITADAPEVMAGVSTVIRWNVSPAEGVSIDVAADSGEPIIATDQCEGDLQSILDASDANPLDPKPAVGCAVVTPAAKTVYTVTATDANDAANVVTASAEVGVSEATLDVVSFTANKQENAAVLNFNDPVLLEWLVTPAGAQVTIEASPPAGCELPQAKASTGALESLSCTIAANTTFTLTATMGELSAPPRVVTVSQQASGSADLKITAAGWSFPNEEIEMKIEPAGNAAAITKISIDDASQTSGRVDLPGFQGQPMIIQKVRVPQLGVRVRWECTGCEKPRDTLAISALPVTPKVFQNAGKVLPIVKISPMPAAQGVFLYGTSAGYNEGTAYVFKSGISLADELMLSLDFGAKILGLDNLTEHMNPTFLNKMDYPVGAVAVAASGRIYAGVSGALLSSDDGGTTWNLVDPFFAYANNSHSYPGQHPSCAGETQKGNAASGSDWVIASFHQFCDALTFNEKGLMVATDRGVFTLDDVDAYVADRTKQETAWKGIPESNQTSSSTEELMTFSRVANDLQEADGKVFAATSQGSGTAAGGVFMTANHGESWAAFGLDGVNVYGLAYDPQAKKLYAGTADGVQVTGVESASWAAVGSLGKAVYSLAIDPYSAGGVILAGTSEGISILRSAVGSSQATWSAIEAGGGSGVGKVRSLVIDSHVNDAAGKVSHHISIGTPIGVIAGSVEVNVTGVTVTNPEAPPAAEQPPAEQPDGDQPPAEEQPPADQPPEDEQPEEQPQE